MTEELNTNEQQEKLTSDRMRNTPIGKLLVQMSLPAILSMFVQALYNVVDSIFVANITDILTPYNGTKLGDDSFMAVSIVFPMTFLVTAVAIGIGVGANAYIARKLGEGNKEKASNAAKTAIFLVFCAWVVMLILAFTVSGPFSKAFVNETNSTDVKYVSEQATLYLTMYFACSLGTMFEITCGRILQSTGNMRVPMTSQLIGAITNIILDAVFILVFKWGVFGAILATVIGQWCAALFVLMIFIFKKQDVSINLKGFKFRKDYFSNILRIGLPAFVMNAMSSVITIVLNILLQQGNGLFVLSAYFKIQSFVFMPVFGLMQGVMPIMSYNYGANQKKRFDQTFRLSLYISLSVMIVGTLIFQLLPSQIMSILTPDADKIADGVYCFRITSISFIPAALSIVLITMLQSINKGLASLLMSLSRQLVILLPMAFILFHYWQLQGIWFCYPIAEITSVLIFIPIIIIAYKKQFEKKRQQIEQMAK